jgi:hypothetical protein
MKKKNAKNSKKQRIDLIKALGKVSLLDDFRRENFHEDSYGNFNFLYFSDDQLYLVDGPGIFDRYVPVMDEFGNVRNAVSGNMDKYMSAYEVKYNGRVYHSDALKIWANYYRIGKFLIIGSNASYYEVVSPKSSRIVQVFDTTTGKKVLEVSRKIAPRVYSHLFFNPHQSAFSHLYIKRQENKNFYNVNLDRYTIKPDSIASFKNSIQVSLNDTLLMSFHRVNNFYSCYEMDTINNINSSIYGNTNVVLLHKNSYSDVIMHVVDGNGIHTISLDGSFSGKINLYNLFKGDRIKGGELVHLQKIYDPESKKLHYFFLYEYPETLVPYSLPSTDDDSYSAVRNKLLYKTRKNFSVFADTNPDGLHEFILFNNRKKQVVKNYLFKSDLQAYCKDKGIKLLKDNAGIKTVGLWDVKHRYLYFGSMQLFSDPHLTDKPPSERIRTLFKIHKYRILPDESLKEVKVIESRLMYNPLKYGFTGHYSTIYFKEARMLNDNVLDMRGSIIILDRGLCSNGLNHRYRDKIIGLFLDDKYGAVLGVYNLKNNTFTEIEREKDNTTLTLFRTVGNQKFAYLMKLTGDKGADIIKIDMDTLKQKKLFHLDEQRDYSTIKILLSSHKGLSNRMAVYENTKHHYIAFLRYQIYLSYNDHYTLFNRQRDENAELVMFGVDNKLYTIPNVLLPVVFKNIRILRQWASPLGKTQVLHSVQNKGDGNQYER